MSDTPQPPPEFKPGQTVIASARLTMRYGHGLKVFNLANGQQCRIAAAKEGKDRWYYSLEGNDPEVFVAESAFYEPCGYDLYACHGPRPATPSENDEWSRAPTDDLFPANPALWVLTVEMDMLYGPNPTHIVGLYSTLAEAEAAKAALEASEKYSPGYHLLHIEEYKLGETHDIL